MLRDITITNAVNYAVEAIGTNNTLSMNRVMIDSPGLFGLRVANDSNTVTVNNSTFTGIAAGRIAIDIATDPNTVNGANNTATVGRECRDSGSAWTGTLVINGTSFTAANCP